MISENQNTLIVPLCFLFFFFKKKKQVQDIPPETQNQKQRYGDTQKNRKSKNLAKYRKSTPTTEIKINDRILESQDPERPEKVDIRTHIQN